MGLWIQFVITLAMMAVSYILTPKPSQPKINPEEISNIPTVQEGESIPVLFGTRNIKGASVTWYGDLRTKAIKEKTGK
ncbi:hypothetical protein [Marinobacterium stanieri]|uniref:Uncharacterized protein n=1 Tax=Marinobacterium stanieri TaxID=49186 RepID=A0A1N6RQI6_9GAMM|nr:hypothetical protein [Marinobacterium stanieri]SIQ31075.1 hypothetical protein SAMN05421647_103467 [Marinobacterium stanieri]